MIKRRMHESKTMNKSKIVMMVRKKQFKDLDIYSKLKKKSHEKEHVNLLM